MGSSKLRFNIKLNVELSQLTNPKPETKQSILHSSTSYVNKVKMKIKLDSKNTENAQTAHSKFPVELSIP
jgi:hypothetical protein